jgi:hypothetical protein
MKRYILICIGCVATFALQSVSAFDSGSDGSDGALIPETSVVIDLGLATTASWTTPSPNPGRGVYDPQQWVVVFNSTAQGKLKELSGGER